MNSNQVLGNYGNGEKIDGKIACVRCYTVQDYTSKNGTTNLLKHIDDCLNSEKRKSLASLSHNAIKTIKSSINVEVVKFVAQDLRSFRTTSCPGFLGLADKLISIGHRYGPIKAKDILPFRKTFQNWLRKKQKFSDSTRYKKSTNSKRKGCQSQLTFGQKT